MKIKVIKKKDLQNRSQIPFTVGKNDPRKEKREMVSKVSNWVEESQRLQHAEMKQAFARLFALPL